MADIEGQKISENENSKEIDATDVNGNGDKDIDLETLTYSCFFDKKIDKAVGENSCANLRGSKFDPKKWKLNWKPDFFQAGIYEIKIVIISIVN